MSIRPLRRIGILRTKDNRVKESAKILPRVKDNKKNRILRERR